MGRGLKTLLITVGIIVLVIIIIYGYFTGMYNNLVRLNQGVVNAWGDVQSSYQRRADLIPNLVETVKGYAAHEKDTLQAVIEARSRVGSINVDQSVVNNPESFKKFENAQSDLGNAISRLLVVQENYPNLKANENFMDLQTQLEGTENRINVARTRYNQAVMDFNSSIGSFPASALFGKRPDFQQKNYFQASQGSETAPRVKF